MVPTLLHDGRPIRESSVICEYLDDVFAETAIRPEDPVLRAEVRYWTKAVDESSTRPAARSPSCLPPPHHSGARRGADEGIPRFHAALFRLRRLARTQEDLCATRLEAPDARAKVELYDRYLHRMEDSLQRGDWLVGDRFSSPTSRSRPNVMRLDMLSMQGMWSGGRLPRVEAWLANIKGGRAFAPRSGTGCPTTLTEQLRVNGARSWPEVAAILEIDAG